LSHRFVLLFLALLLIVQVLYVQNIQSKKSECCTLHFMASTSVSGSKSGTSNTYIDIKSCKRIYPDAGSPGCNVNAKVYKVTYSARAWLKALEYGEFTVFVEVTYPNHFGANNYQVWPHRGRWKVTRFPGDTLEVKVSGSYGPVAPKAGQTGSIGGRAYAGSDGGARFSYSVSFSISASISSCPVITCCTGPKSGYNLKGCCVCSSPPSQHTSSLIVKSTPIKGIKISYSGDFSGSKTTDFTLSKTASNSAFTVNLTAPVNGFVKWVVGGNEYYNRTIMVSVPDKNEKTAMLHVKPTYLNVKAEYNGTPLNVDVEYSGDFSGSKTTPFTLSKLGDLAVSLTAPVKAYLDEFTVIDDPGWTGSSRIQQLSDGWWRLEDDTYGGTIAYTTGIKAGGYKIEYEYSIPRMGRIYVTVRNGNKIKKVLISKGPSYNPSSGKGTIDLILDDSDYIHVYLRKRYASNPPAWLKIRILKMKEVEFTKWIVYENGIVKKSSTNRQIALTVPNTKNWTAVAYYGSAPNPPTPPETRYNQIYLNGTWVLPGSWISAPRLFGELGAGNYTINVTAPYNAPPLEALVFNGYSCSWRGFWNAELELKSSLEFPYCTAVATEGKLCNLGKLNLSDFEAFITINGVTYGLLGFRSKMNLTGYMTGTTTLAVYNFTLVRNDTKVLENGTVVYNYTAYIAPLVVSSFNLTVYCVYDAYGVNVIWIPRYYYIPPREFMEKWNITEIDKPYQEVWLTLEKEGRILYSQLLGNTSYILNETPCAGIYITYSELEKKFGWGETKFIARVRWSGINDRPAGEIPHSIASYVTVKTVALKMIRLREDPLELEVVLVNVHDDGSISSFKAPDEWIGACLRCRFKLWLEWNDTMLSYDANVDVIHTIIRLDTHIRWPRMLTVYYIPPATTNLVLIVLPFRI